MTRFAKGRSGNPKGRPRKTPVTMPSAFDVIIDQRLTVTQDGKTRELTVEEGLQLKTYQQALAGSRTARREVLKMIAKREEWFAKHRPQVRKVTLKQEYDSDNANEAMLLLGVISPDPWYPELPDRYTLEPWAVAKALARPGGSLSKRELTNIRACVRNAGSIRWPQGVD